MCVNDLFVCSWLLCISQPAGGTSKTFSTEQDYYQGPDGSVGSSPMRTDLGLL